MKKIILVSIILLMCVGNISANYTIDYVTLNEYDTKCLYGIYIEAFGISNTNAIISIYERTNNIDCIKYTDRSFVFLNTWDDTDYFYINDRDSMVNPRFWYWFDSYMNVTVYDISDDTITFKIYTGVSTAPPTPTPTPAPTPDPTPSDTPEPDNGSYYNGTYDYGGDIDGMGAAGGRGGVYESIGQGLGDGGSGNKATSMILFYSMIPVLFVIVTLIFIGKLLGIKILSR